MWREDVFEIKGILNKAAVMKRVMFYELEYWVLDNATELQMNSLADIIRMQKLLSWVTLKNRKINKFIKGNVGVASILENMSVMQV